MEYEHVGLVKHEVFMYQIPPRTSSRGYRAADWKLDEPNWTGRLKIVTKGETCTIRLEDKNSGDLFAECPVETFPGIAVESVSDSSRYFVIRVQDGSGKAAFIGIGFADRSDSFDFNVALQDHFKYIEKQKTQDQNDALAEAQPQKSLGFQPGQTIKINIDIARKGKPKAKKTGGMGEGGVLLPPPPGMKKVGAPSSTQVGATVPLVDAVNSNDPFQAAGAVSSNNVSAPQTEQSNASLLLDFDFGAPPSSDSILPTVTSVAGSAQDLLGDFTAAPASAPTQEEPTTPDWVTF